MSLVDGVVKLWLRRKGGKGGRQAKGVSLTSSRLLDVFESAMPESISVIDLCKENRKKRKRN